jgi:predicted enzyme related to lactoylglutathione lyase
MTIKNALASLAVKDLNSAVTWYEALLGASPDRPMPEVAEWHFERGGGLQVYQRPERAGNCSCTLAVDDIEAEIDRWNKLHVDTSNRIDGDSVKVVMIQDPDGNHIALAQALDPALLK